MECVGGVLLVVEGSHVCLVGFVLDMQYSREVSKNMFVEFRLKASGKSEVGKQQTTNIGLCVM